MTIVGFKNVMCLQNFEKLYFSKFFDDFLLKYLGLRGAKACKSCRPRQELSNEYVLATFGVDTAENGSYKVCSFG